MRASGWLLEDIIIDSTRTLISAAMKSRSFDQHLLAFVLCLVMKEYFLGGAEVSDSGDSLEESD
jgi:hypothetical protein